GFAAGHSLTVVFDGDAEAPVWPEGSSVTVTEVTYSSAKLNWSFAEDNVGVTAYRIYLDNAPIDTVSASVYNYDLAGLSAGTTYNVKVEAGDAAGNWSVDGPTATFTTVSDSTPAATVTLTASATELATMEELALTAVVAGTDGTPTGTVT